MGYADDIRNDRPSPETTATLIEGVCANDFGAWSTWSPTLTAGGSMTVSNETVATAKYIQVGKFVSFILYISGFELAGTGASTVHVTWPVAGGGTDTHFSSQLRAAGTFLQSTMVGHASYMRFYRDPNLSTAWTIDATAANQRIYCSGTFEAS